MPCGLQGNGADNNSVSFCVKYLFPCCLWLMDNDTIAHSGVPAPTFHCNHVSFLVNNMNSPVTVKWKQKFTNKIAVCHSFDLEPSNLKHMNLTSSLCNSRNPSRKWQIQGTLFECTPIQATQTSTIYIKKVQHKLSWEENRPKSTSEGNSCSLSLSIILIVMQKKKFLQKSSLTIILLREGNSASAFLNHREFAVWHFFQLLDSTFYLPVPATQYQQCIKEWKKQSLPR